MNIRVAMNLCVCLTGRMWNRASHGQPVLHNKSTLPSTSSSWSTFSFEYVSCCDSLLSRNGLSSMTLLHEHSIQMEKCLDLSNSSLVSFLCATAATNSKLHNLSEI